MPEGSAWERLPWLAIYAALAFAGQLPAAWVIERTGRARGWLVFSLGAMGMAVLAAQVSPGLAVLVSGVASAFVHVAGGALALRLPRGERALGWFAAPGILGLTLGGWLAFRFGELAWWAAAAPLLLLVGCAGLRARWPAEVEEEGGEMPAALEAHDGLMLLVLLALTLRSAVWDLVQASQFATPSAVIAVALSAAAGKVLGGWLSARFPGIRPVALVLLVSCALLHWSRERLLGLCVGVALLQSAIPASIVLLHRSFSVSRARAAAYGFGVTVALGGLVWPFPGTLPICAASLALSALVMIWAGRRHSIAPASRAATSA
jgi:FSR family fosmidomycin resistance protein-like MFS transporter